MQCSSESTIAQIHHVSLASYERLHHDVAKIAGWMFNQTMAEWLS